jgi:hypothetical protein
MKQRLFVGDDENWSDVAKQYANEVDAALRPIIDRACAEGQSLRDLHTIINSSANELILARLLGWNK